MHFKVAIVGCGQISRAHITALNEIEGNEICAVCDQVKDRAIKAAGLAQGAKVYINFANLLQQERPDVVHVLTPPTTHAHLAIQAMEAGCHVLIEKPMALNLQDADILLSAARKNGVKLCANHNYLFKPSVMKARKLVESGAIGQVVYVSSYYGLSGEGGSYAGGIGRSHWAGRLPGGIFTNFLPHLIYLQLAFLHQVDSVSGVSVAKASRPGDPTTGLTILLQSDNASGLMAFSMLAKPYAKFVDIFGTRGIIHADLVREVCTIKKERRLPRMLSKVVFNLEDTAQLALGTAANTTKFVLGNLKNMPGLRVLVHRFYDSIRNDKEPPVPGEEARRVIEIMEMIWAKSLELPSFPPAPLKINVQEGPKTDSERTFALKKRRRRILVTGATGFLGYHLVSALSRSNANVVALVREKNCVAPELERQAELVCGDVRDSASIKAAMRNVDIVYHCAAITTNKASWAEHYATNVKGTETICREAVKAGVERLIHVSSVIVYGLKRSPRKRLIKESDILETISDKWAHYMRSKIEAEKVAFRFWHQAKLPVTVLRPGILYGPGTGRDPARGLAQLGALRLSIGRGRNRLPYTYIDNAVDCLLLAAISSKAVGQAFNVVDEPQVNIQKFTTLSGSIRHERVKLLPVPIFLFSSVARILEHRNNRNGSEIPPRLSRFVIQSACRDMHYDTTKARLHLGWQSEVSLEEGLRRTFSNL